MGRYESQRAIAARTISDHRPGRKRSTWGWSAVRRLSALAVTLGALLGASWLGPRLRRTPQIQAEPPRPALVELVAPKVTSAAKPIELVQPAPAPRPRRRTAHAPAPAQAAPDDDIEVLSAEELAGISQAD